MRALGSTTRLPQFTRNIPTQLHESTKNSPQKLTQPRNMITFDQIPGNPRPSYAALNPLETELKTRWVPSPNAVRLLNYQLLSY